MDESHVPPGVCECYLLFLRPYAPCGRPCLMAEPVLSVSARDPSCSATSQGLRPCRLPRSFACRARRSVIPALRLPLLLPSPPLLRLLVAAAAFAAAVGEVVAAAGGLAAAAAVATAAWGFSGQIYSKFST